MSVTVNYLGILAEITGKSSELLETAGSKTTIMDEIMERYPGLKTYSFVISHNGVISHTEILIKKGDQITLIPPAPGG